jgi:hypothetical protein
MPPQRSPDNRGFAGQPDADDISLAALASIPLIWKRSIGEDAVEQQSEVEDRPEAEYDADHNVRPDLSGQEHVVGEQQQQAVCSHHEGREERQNPQDGRRPGKGALAAIRSQLRLPDALTTTSFRNNQSASSKHQQPFPRPSSLSGEGFSRRGRNPLTFARFRAAAPVAIKCGPRSRRKRAPTQCTLQRSSYPPTSPLPFPLPTGHTSIHRREICVKHNMGPSKDARRAFQIPDL